MLFDIVLKNPKSPRLKPIKAGDLNSNQQPFLSGFVLYVSQPAKQAKGIWQKAKKSNAPISQTGTRRYLFVTKRAGMDV